MHFALILFLVAGIIACVNGSNDLLAGVYRENLCPSEEDIAPCICFKAPISNRITAKCTNFTNALEMKTIFNRHPNWHLQDVWIDKSVMYFLPAKMLEKAHFQGLNVTSCTFVKLFDRTPVATPIQNLYLSDVKLLRGLHWRSIAKTNLSTLSISNMKIKSFGREFKHNVPKGVQRMWFINTGVASIKYQAFSHLRKLKILFLKGGKLKQLSRDMFPTPWVIEVLDLSYQRITDLPENFFADLPKLTIFNFEGNLLTTISEKVFTKHRAIYYFKGNPIDCNCSVRWITIKLNPKYLHGECSEPKSLRGTKLGVLKIDTFRQCN